MFRYQDGRYLTRQRLVTELRQVLDKAGLYQSKYCGHSFRIGAATTAAERGIEDDKAGLYQSKYCGHSFRIGAATTAAERDIEDALRHLAGGAAWHTCKDPTRTAGKLLG